MILKKCDKQLTLFISLMVCAIIECFMVFFAEHRKYIILTIAVFFIAMILAGTAIFETKKTASDSTANKKASKFIILSAAMLAVELILIGIIARFVNVYFMNINLISVLRGICALSYVISIFALIDGRVEAVQWITVYIICMCILLVCNLTFYVVLAISL